VVEVVEVVDDGEKTSQRRFSWAASLIDRFGAWLARRHQTMWELLKSSSSPSRGLWLIESSPVMNG
jgi:hypothetical protein